MKTFEEILERCKDSDSFFGFDLEVLIRFLPFDIAKELLKEDSKKENWEQKELTVKNIVSEMEKYMEFAWGKVEDHRGISASRSIEKMQAWLWILEDEELLKFSDDDSNYKNYGAPILSKISNKYGFPVPDNEGVDNMINQLKCCDDCDGCGD